MLKTQTTKFTLDPADTGRIALLMGAMNQNLQLVESCLDVDIHLRGAHVEIQGEQSACDRAKKVLEKLYHITRKGHPLNPSEIQLIITSIDFIDSQPTTVKIKSQHGSIRPRTQNQAKYLEALMKFDINFGIGPAGTGKTFLAVAAASYALQNDLVDRIVLVRPAVEAGEKLGFLPGDLSQKVDPYLRPLYDGLYEMMGAEKVTKLIERNVIEIAPLAYMRGRTLNNAFVILDESQNTTREQMKMFLTRIGFGSKAVITGDPTQIDLPRKDQSGLVHAIEVLKNIDAINFTTFAAKDVVRHPLVQRIVKAYDQQ